MPTYEYACKECGEHHEVHQSFNDPSLTECPSCGGPLRKVFGNIAIAFKGSGFYKNDSRSSNGKSDVKKDGEAKSDSKSETSTTGSGSSSSGDSSSSSSSTSSSSNGGGSSSPATPAPSSDGGSKPSTSSPPPKTAAAS